MPSNRTSDAESKSESTRLYQDLSILDRAVPSVLDSYLRGADFTSSFRGYFNLNTPKFRKFDTSSESEYTLDQQIAHQEYMSTADALLEGRLSEFGYNAESFSEVLEIINFERPDDSTTNEILLALKQYLGFEDFGCMMFNKYSEIYGDHNGESSRNDSNDYNNNIDNTRSHVRILWDIENIQTPKNRTSFDTANAIRSFLKTKQIIKESNCDSIMTVFYCTEKRTLSKKDAQGLDHASVEQIFVSSKREDADRKLVSKMMEFMEYLPSKSTTFVLLSSDLDFVKNLEFVKNKGFDVFCIHNAVDSEQEKSLKQHCKGCYRYKEVLNEMPTAPPQDDMKYDSGENKAKQSKQNNKPNKDKNIKINYGDFYKIGTTHTGTVKLWNAAAGWGFLLSDQMTNDSKESTLFVHNTSLPSCKFRFLAKGEQVKFVVVEGKKGVMAGEVVGVNEELLECQRR